MKSILPLIIQTYKASVQLRSIEDALLKKTLLSLAGALEQNMDSVLQANAKDLAKQDADNPRNDRLMLNEQRILSIANSIRNISNLPNPCGNILQKRALHNGLQLEKKSVPLGVVGAIYESRPNVTFDIAALCLRSQNACVLKGSSDAEETNKAGVDIIRRVLEENNIPVDAVTLLPSERETVQELFTATKYIDVLIPRGSDGLIQYVRKNSLVPVIETGAGVCHVYVEKDADLAKALNIVVNAKVSRPSVCNAADTIIVDKSVAEKFLKGLQPLFDKFKVEIFADETAYSLLNGYTWLHKAAPEDFGREFLSLKCAIRVVMILMKLWSIFSNIQPGILKQLFRKIKRTVSAFCRKLMLLPCIQTHLQDSPTVKNLAWAQRLVYQHKNYTQEGLLLWKNL